ncbi:MAG: class II fructose-bisphosphate aldolase [Christensenellales bacterium]|nr:class II fructose-bisphosphate aldolase [Christensenellales bacterium]
MYVSMKPILQHAHAHGYAVPAINCINMEMARGAISAAEEARAAIIINLGVGQMGNHAHSEEMVPMIKELAARATVPVALNLDHGGRLEDIARCLNLGFSSIMIDASSFDFEENIRRTAIVSAMAHALNVCVEGELGHVGQANARDDEDADLYTNPKQAREFVERTGVDALAVAIGTAHGNYLHHKVPRLDFDRLRELKSLLNMPLVLHGGSGSGDENLRKAVSCGINKVNICTDAFQICKTAFLLTQAQQPDMDYMHLCMAVEQQMKAFTRHHLDVLGASGQYVYGENVTDSRE